MSEERLQEIKDSLNAQYEIAKSDNKYQSVYFVLDEEKELIEEIERLNNIIKEIKEYIEFLKQTDGVILEEGINKIIDAINETLGSDINE